MRKILSLLTVLTLLATPITSVVACGTQKNKQDDAVADTVDQIRDKLNSKNIDLTSSSVGKTFKSEESTIRNTIISNNWLTSADLKLVTFTNNPTFLKNVKTSINFSVANSGSKTPLTGTMTITAVVTDLTAEQIKNKLKTASIILNKDKVGKKISEVTTIIKNQLTSIVDADALNYVSFKDATITASLKTIDFTVSKDAKTASGQMKLSIINNKKSQNANDIAQLINTKDTLYLPNYVSADTSNVLTIEQLKQAIYNSSSQQFIYDNNIIQSDLQYLSFSKQTLTRGDAQNQIDVYVNKNGQKATIPVKVNVRIVDDNNQLSKTYRAYIDVGQLQVQKMNLTNLYMKGVTHVMMAFIQSQTINGVHVPSWAGDTPIFQESTAAAKAALNYYDNQISKFQALGGKVGISFGGANGTTIWEGQTEDTIYNNLKKIADKYKPDMFDFDIEGTGLTDKAGTKQLVLALNRLLNEDAYKNIEVGITIAADPGVTYGLNPQFINLTPNQPLTLDSTCGQFSYLNIPTKPIVDVMAMDYGPVSWIDKFGNGVRGARMYYAATLLPDMISKSIYDIWKLNPDYAKNHSQMDIRNNFGITPMIGVNDVAGEIFFKEDAAKLSQWANANNIKWIGAWSLTRDHAPRYKDGRAEGLGQLDIAKSGVLQDEYRYSNIFTNLYTNPGKNKKPIPASAKLSPKSYVTAPKMVGVTWDKIKDAIKYNVYFDNKLIKTTLTNGAYYYDKNLKEGSHTVKVEALGVNGSSVTQSIIVNVPKPQGTKWNPKGVTATISMFDKNNIYRAGDTVFFKKDGQWILRYVKSWFEGEWTEWNHIDLKAVSEYVGTYLSQQLINDLNNNNTLPSWYPTQSFN